MGDHPTGPPVDVCFDFLTVGAVDIAIHSGPETLLLGGACCGTDALGDLLRLVLTIATGAESATCAFDLEPHALQVIVKRVHSQPGTVEFTAYELAHHGAPLSEGVQTGRLQCAAEDLALAIERAASTVLRNIGPDGYRQTWGWEFPARALAALNAVLALPPPAIGPALVGDDVTLRRQFLASSDPPEGQGKG
jgi:hypothetical protein